jgi:hypothetical protein
MWNVWLRSNGGFNIGLVTSRWEHRMYIANECYDAKVVSLDYNGSNPVVQYLANNYAGAIIAIDDNIFVSTTDGTTNSTAFLEVHPAICGCLSTWRPFPHCFQSCNIILQLSPLINLFFNGFTVSFLGIVPKIVSRIVPSAML